MRHVAAECNFGVCSPKSVELQGHQAKYNKHAKYTRMCAPLSILCVCKSRRQALSMRQVCNMRATGNPNTRQSSMWQTQQMCGRRCTAFCFASSGKCNNCRRHAGWHCGTIPAAIQKPSELWQSRLTHHTPINSYTSKYIRTFAHK